MPAPIVRICVALLLSTGIALTISWVADLDPNVTKPGGEPMVVFRNAETRTITEETIVDELIALRLHADIRRVNIGNRWLEVDLEIDPGGREAKAVTSDIAALAKLGLAEADNIARVFVRVLEKDGEEEDASNKTLLLALTAGKSDFTEEELADLREGERNAEEWFGSKLKLRTTERWRSLNGTQ
ncbi:hypothetical protein [Paenibacillus alkalitolerans]|uniref:hypothetical protein n=1 Tax=Paenibacillus alkalitolerans TaxID=2799335 RepID=UPI0018F5070E|nr:hypothetical protein [Paenibacillus alkalitolerans]